MKCDYRYCDLDVPANRTKYCSRKCGQSEFKLLVNSGKAVRSDLKRLDYTKTGDECKWCIDSDHEEFCCPAHRSQYKEFRKVFDIEMARQKPKPTEAQLKGYAKIEYALINKKI